MKSGRQYFSKLRESPDPEGAAPIGPYDGAAAETELWFLPPEENEAELDRFAAPLPIAAHKSLFDLAAWQAAEAELAKDLAELAHDLGRLTERVHAMGQGAVTRLAQDEAAGMSWWTGDRISVDRIALWLSWRIGADGEDGGALIRTAWAARHLAAAPLARGDLAASIAHDLGLSQPGGRDLAADVASILPAPGELGPLTLGCALFYLWRGLQERPDHLRDIEAAVLGARFGVFRRGEALRRAGLPIRNGASAGVGQGGGLAFLPLVRTGPTALAGQGSAAEKLRRWIAGSQDAVLSALMSLERLRLWREAATEATADLSGRTPALLLNALQRAPMVAVPQLVEQTGSTSATVRRNLALFAKRGLVREVTGQGRFRVWAAKSDI